MTIADYIRREEVMPDVFCEGVSCQECPFCKDPVQGGCRIDDFVKSIPAADVVEVVRCKDCIYWRGENDLCKGICIDFDADGYCSEGKRMDGGQDDA